MKKTTQGLIEMIIVRLNSISDADVVQRIFIEMAEAFRQPAYQLRSVRLCKSEQVENDWAIYLHHPAKKGDGKPGLAVSLAEMLRSVGLVHHTVWRSCDAGDIGEILDVFTSGHH